MSYKQILDELAKQSTCQVKQVAAILVDETGQIVGQGVNGTPDMYEHCNTLRFSSRIAHHQWSEAHETHAEVRCIADACSKHVDLTKCTMYITLSPCIHCAKMIHAFGIRRVKYVELYDLDLRGVKFLTDANVVVLRLCHK